MVERAARRQAWRKICAQELQLFIVYYTLNKHSIVSWFFLKDKRFCRNDLSNWKDKRSALFCPHEPLVWLSIAPNVIIIGGTNYLPATSHNFQICFKTASCSMPGNKSVLGNKRAEQSLCNITSADRHLQKIPQLEHSESLAEDLQVTLQLWVLRRWKFQSACLGAQLFLSTGLRKLQIN